MRILDFVKDRRYRTQGLELIPRETECTSSGCPTRTVLGSLDSIDRDRLGTMHCHGQQLHAYTHAKIVGSCLDPGRNVEVLLIRCTRPAPRWQASAPPQASICCTC